MGSCAILILIAFFHHISWAMPVDVGVSSLLAFKETLVDVDDNLQSWSSSDASPCRWSGITCDVNSEVKSVNLHGLSLSGSLSSSICGISSLLVLNLSNNFITGPIPMGMASCRNLTVLDLSTNRLHGSIPEDLCSLSSLRGLHLRENFLSDEIPVGIGNLTNLEELVIHSNNLTGGIPSSVRWLKRLRIIRAGINSLSGPIPIELMECESLETLGLSGNRFVGPIPKEIQRLRNLTTLVLWQNHIDGEIPPEIGNMTSLEMIALNQNELTGPIPKELGKLSMLKKLYMYTNMLSGSIPRELGNCVDAVEIDLSENQLTGSIPKEFGRLQNLALLQLFENLLQGSIPRELGQLRFLTKLDLSINELTGMIPTELQNLTSLESLQLFDNNLQGVIPPLLGSNSSLSVLDVSDNMLAGNIPPQLCKYQKLFYLSVGSNMLIGNIPEAVKTCKSLVQLRLGNNRLTGSLPVELSTIPNLSAIELYSNRFSGPLPSEIGNLTNLERLLLSDNYFMGQIPPQIGLLTALVSFNVSSNQLSGSIPHELAHCIKLQRLDLSRNNFTGHLSEEFGKLVHLELLKLSDNHLSGHLTSSLGHLSRLTELQMGGNHFSGCIPYQFGNLNALQISLNLSYNNLSCKIPSDLGNLQMLEAIYLNNNQLEGDLPPSFGELSSLVICNISNNKLVGSLPDNPAFLRMDPSNFLGNPGLCRLGSNACQPFVSQSFHEKSKSSGKGISREKLVSIVAALVGGVSLALTVAICLSIQHKEQPHRLHDSHSLSASDHTCYYPKGGISYQEIVDATGNFSETAVIGQGACGTVYKAIMSDGSVIAVKRINHQREGSRVDGTFHAEISTLGNVRHRNIVKLYGFCYRRDFCLILYECMANGNLREKLHGSDETCLTDWGIRYKIALGAAEGLSYLHSDCKPQIIHRDIKSNNILLDEEFEAHVGDFGLAKLIDSSHSKTMSSVAGSFGYIAPEYAFTMKVTDKCDIYSFGVVLLELITGKFPIQPPEEGGDLVTYVRRSIRNIVPMKDLFDCRLDMTSSSTMEEISLFLKIALFCTNESPADRPSMREVVTMMVDAREQSASPCRSTPEHPLDEDSSAQGIGDVILKAANGSLLTLTNVRHALDMDLNLISAGQLDDEGYDNIFGGGRWKLTHGSIIVAQGKKLSNNLYVLQASISIDMVHAIKDEKAIDLWHRRLGHMSKKKMQCLITKNFLSYVKKERLDRCTHCFPGKNIFFQKSSSKKDANTRACSHKCFWSVKRRSRWSDISEEGVHYGK